ncbi:MAG TPA: pyridoxamine 5'-phosphate oxidase family protein [Fimbriimonadaceae bacterium]|nr:pyridoxamine 5'-phosphate oxidase family protein [Fimbriimonadaceae bacterium]
MESELLYTYHSAQRALQEQFDSVRLADRVVERSFQRELDDYDKRFIESQGFFFLATVDPGGEPFCNFRAGNPGFVTVVTPTCLEWPEFNGNGMYLTLGNLAANSRVHLLFIDFERQERFRVAGRASVHTDAEAVDPYFEAQAVVRVAVEKAFPNCKRYIPKMQLVEPSRHIPKSGTQTPAAYWKRMDRYGDVLPAGDPAADPSVPD